MRNRQFLAALLLALSPALSAASGDPAVGKKKSAPCAVCHGADGVSASPDFPTLAGQYPDYLESAMKHYKNGKRKNPIMAEQVKALSPKDMMDLAAYFASQRALQTRY